MVNVSDTMRLQRSTLHIIQYLYAYKLKLKTNNHQNMAFTSEYIHLSHMQDNKGDEKKFVNKKLISLLLPYISSRT